MPGEHSFLAMANYIEVCLRQMILHLKRENYDGFVQETAFIGISDLDKVKSLTCPCAETSKCPGSLDFLNNQKVCPYFLSWFKEK